jgi:hypothetical protein
MQRLVCPRVVVALPPTDDNNTNLTPASRLLAAFGRSPPISQASVLQNVPMSPGVEDDVQGDTDDDCDGVEDEDIEVDVEACTAGSRADADDDDEDAMDLSRHLSEDSRHKASPSPPPTSLAGKQQVVAAVDSLAGAAVSCSSSGVAGHRLAFSVENILDPTKFTGRALCWRPLDGPADDELSGSDLGEMIFFNNYTHY